MIGRTSKGKNEVQNLLGAIEDGGFM